MLMCKTHAHPYKSTKAIIRKPTLENPKLIFIYNYKNNLACMTCLPFRYDPGRANRFPSKNKSVSN